MKYKLINLSWFKRRIPDNQLSEEIVDIKLVGFEYKRFSICDMIVYYENKEIKLKGQVIHNKIKDLWMVNGIDNAGNQVAIEIMRGDNAKF